MYRFVVDLLEPHTILSLCVALALFQLWRKRREPTRRLLPLILPLAGLALVSNPIVAHFAMLSLESQYPAADEKSPAAEALVVFAAGLYAPSGPRLRAELDEDTLHRCLHAAHLYTEGPPRLVLVSGGKVEADDPGPTCAAVMADFLRQLGVKESDLVVEQNSRSTYENAVESAKLLRERGCHGALLVVDAVDMPRAALCLRKQGIEVLPAPCHYRVTNFELSLFSFLPSPGAANGFRRVWHEWLGLAWYWLRGRL
jgi:uncharacterized SAM-binding protein YcdF (DUF218 family)